MTVRQFRVALEKIAGRDPGTDFGANTSHGIAVAALQIANARAAIAASKEAP